MIDLGRLVIKPGDIVKAPDGTRFKVDKTVIENFVQMIYPETGKAYPADSVMIVDKNEEMTIADKNKIALETILNSIYGDRWDIVSYFNNRIKDIADAHSGSINTKYVLLIHFPEIEIKNSDGKSHLIRDLYTANFLDENYKFSSTELQGKRITRTRAEVNSTYAHSHLSTSREIKELFKRFCTGTGVINETIMLARDVNPSDDHFTYEIYFESLNSFVAWESLEGGPYRRIHNISDNPRHRSPYKFSKLRTTDLKLLEGLKKFLKDTDFILPITWNFNPRSVNSSSSVIVIDKQQLKNDLINHFKNVDNVPNVIRDSSAAVFVSEVDLHQSQLGISFNQIINNLKAIKKENDNNNDYIVVQTEKSNLVFRGKRLNEKILDRPEKENINHITINNSLIDMLINDILFKFYGKLFKDEDKLFESFTNDKA